MTSRPEKQTPVTPSAEAKDVAAKGNQRKVFVRTYGCQMNVYDSERMTDVLAPEGFEATDTLEEADLVLLNTCHIREKAAEKVYSELGRIRKVKEDRARAGKDMMVGVAGCVAQAEGEEISRRAPIVDLVVGPQSYHQLPSLLEKARQGTKVVETEFDIDAKFDHLSERAEKPVQKRPPSAFLTVQEGCDKFCTFCVVPYTRGAEVSRSVEQIVSEAERMAAAGVREVTLLGQNVNAYHGEAADGATWGLGRLLRRLAEIDGLDRLRYTTSHPRDMDDDLIAAHAELKSLMPYLHLPVQSGSDKILKAMNRRHTREDYFRLLDRIREAAPDIALSGDFIVGFPGETDQDFEDTMDLIRRVEYGSAFSFKYSQRPGTPGATMDDQVPEDVKSARLAELQALVSTQQKAFNASRLGMVCDVLLEKKGRNPGQLVGKSPWLQPVQLDAPENLIGTIQAVEIVDIGSNSLFGRLNAGKITLTRPEPRRLRKARPVENRRRHLTRDSQSSSRKSPDQSPAAASATDMTHIVLAFEDNRLIGDLFGQFDQNLALIEQRLGVDAIARGNQVTLKGSQAGCAQARTALEALYQRLLQGHEIHPGDVDGALRMAAAAEAQLPLPTLEPKSRLAFAQIATRRKTIVARTPMQDAYIRAMDRADLIFGTGPAGTGKTFLAVAYAAALLERGDVARLILSRPAVEAGERLGFLPGEMKDKVDPYLRPIYDALYEMMPAEKVDRGLQSGMIEVAPLAFMRGRTLSNAVVLLDEAQNTTSMQMKMFLTRLGEGSKMIVTGDPSQIDLPSGQKSGLREALGLLTDIQDVAHIRFSETDVVRHELVGRIVTAYDNASREEAVARERRFNERQRNADADDTAPRSRERAVS